MLSEDLLYILYLCDHSLPSILRGCVFRTHFGKKSLSREKVCQDETGSVVGRFHSAEVYRRDSREKGPEGRTLSIYWAIPVCQALCQALEMTRSSCSQRTQSSSGKACSKPGERAEGLSWGSVNRKELNRFNDLMRYEELVNELWMNDILSKLTSLINNSFVSFLNARKWKWPYTFLLATRICKATLLKLGIINAKLEH